MPPPSMVLRAPGPGSEAEMGAQTRRTAVWLALANAATSFAAGVWTLWDHGLLGGPAAMQGSARGTSLVIVVVAVPLLLASVAAALRGSAVALAGWGGSTLYLVYNAVLLLFLTPFNSAFLVYVAMLGTGVWSAAALALIPQVRELGQAVARDAPVRGVATYVWVVAGLNTLLWLGTVVPALDDPYPSPMLAGTGVATNVIYVQDLAVWLPLMAVAAGWLWRREARGAVVVLAGLVLWVVEAVSIAVDQTFGAAADPSSTVVSTALVGPFLVLAVVGLVPLWVLLRRRQGPAGPPEPSLSHPATRGRHTLHHTP
jgi:hypothetical protein